MNRNQELRTHKLFVATIAFVALSAAPVHATILVNHPRNPSGGPGADTAFFNNLGMPAWETAADDFRLATPADIGRVTWLSFYGGDFVGSIHPPSGDETIRVRFYDSRPDETLPGLVLYEQTFLNPPRTATGNQVFVLPSRTEYQYQVDLNTPFQAQAGSTYWLEVAQIGDINSHLRWENGVPDGTSYAFINTNVSDWQVSGAASNLAFQLWDVPEPASACSLGLVLLYRARPRGRCQ